MNSCARTVKNLAQFGDTCVDACKNGHITVVNIRFVLYHVVPYGLLKQLGCSWGPLLWTAHELVRKLCSISVQENDNERAINLLIKDCQLRS
jgi:hypothetical protein